jgi:hypothetical protein
MPQITALVGITTVAGSVIGMVIGQTTPISVDSPVTLSILLGSVVTGFTVGGLLTRLTMRQGQIQNDIKSLHMKIDGLPCHPKCPK